MDLNWEAIGAIGETLAAIAVLATLAYLSLQVRQANLHARSQARQRMIEQTQSELTTVVNDPSLHELMIREDRLLPDEQVKLNAFLVSFMRQREWEWFQYNDGVIDKDVYESYRAVIAFLLGADKTRRWWERIGKAGFDGEFVLRVDDLLDSSGATSYMQDVRSWDDS